MKELRIFGPPGTGKSTRLATEEIPNAIDKFGEDKVIVTSFTRTSAQEIASKKSAKTNKSITIPKDHIGTLHALCYKMLGNPELVNKKLTDWNDQNKTCMITDKAFEKFEDTGIQTNDTFKGNELLNKLNIYRAKMIDRTLWDDETKSFEINWNDFKQQTDTLDFTDLIEKTIDKFIYPPGKADVIFVDEAQDFTRLQLTLVRGWGQMAKWIVLVGDDDQNIYEFAGATSDAFLKPEIDKKYKRILNQSFRIPQSVLEISQKIIKRVSQRELKKYNARKENGKIIIGSVRKINEGFLTPNSIIYDIQQKIKENKSIMIIASCSYMLNNIKHVLKKEGMLFHNPYRVERGDWNPLKSSSNINTSKDLLINFLSTGLDGEYWSVKQMLSWLKNVRVCDDGLKRKKGRIGIKVLEKALKNEAGGLHSVKNVIPQLLNASGLQKALERDVNWLLNNTVQKRQKALEYPIYIYNKFGLDVLKSDPKIIIGTIHSVKGGESDIVYLYPDISYQAKCQLNTYTYTDKFKDSLYRLFYVGMTRAKEELVLMDHSIQKGNANYISF